MNKIKNTTLLLLSLLISSSAMAQNAEMADTMRADGKIFVVVAIILIVLAGLITYLFVMDRKVTKLENLIREKHQQTK